MFKRIPKTPVPRSPQLWLGSRGSDGEFLRAVIIPFEAEYLTGTNLGDLFKQPALATFMRDTGGKIVSEDSFSNVLREVPTYKILNAMADDEEDGHGDYGLIVEVLDLFEVGVLAWV